MREDLRAELLALLADDDDTRARLARDGSLFEGYHPEMEAVHRRNAARLRRIIGELAGAWPGRSAVGEDGAAAAWRILQHSIGEPDLMRGCLPLLEEAATAGEASPADLALLIDRIRVFEGRPQLYGTQYDWDPTLTWMVPIGSIEDPEAIDRRRRAVGLPPMEWRRAPDPDEPPPPDPAARAHEMEEWANRVGWRRPPV